MIQSRNDLKFYLLEDLKVNGYSNYHGISGIIKSYANQIDKQIWNYIRLLRFSEYYKNNRSKSVLHGLLYIHYKHKKNKLGIRLGIEIEENCFGYGLTIFHPQCIVVNGAARIGNYCKLHGNNCIGNKGGEDNVCPVAGDYLDVGVGAKILGPVHLGNNIVVGAGAVVVKDFLENNVTICGIPGKQLMIR